MDGVTLSWGALLAAVVLGTVVYLLETVFFARRSEDARRAELERLRQEVKELKQRLDTLEYGSLAPLGPLAEPVFPPAGGLGDDLADWGELARRAGEEVTPTAGPDSRAGVGWGEPVSPQAPRRRAPRPEAPPPDVEAAYPQAFELARQGADASQLVERFGMSKGEAELIVALHKRPTFHLEDGGRR